MKIIILKGGLGNQLFQVSYAYYLAQCEHKRVLLLTGLLGSYQIKRDFYFAAQLPKDQTAIKVNHSYLLAYVLRVFAFIIEPLFAKHIFIESSRKYSKEKNLKSAFLIDAYLQNFSDQAYFNFLFSNIGYANFIAASLHPYFQNLNQPIKVSQTCLHMRGTDLKYQFDAAQLKRLVDDICNELAKHSPNQGLLVVTDDVAYAQTFIQPSPQIAFQSQNWQVDFLTLANASLLGIIDSTFSIWAGLYALIILKRANMVVAPFCIQKYPLLTYLYQEQKLYLAEEQLWK